MLGRRALFCCLLAAELAGCASQPPIVASDPPSDLAPAGPSVVADAPAADRDIVCYQKIYVPAVYRVDTRGKLVQPAKKKFEVVTSGTITHWNYVRDPAVYLETRRLIEPDHYTLRRIACQGGPDSVRTQLVDAPEGHAEPLF